MRLMILFLAWCILLVLCWPVAVLALVAAPFLLLLWLPFRLLAIVVHAGFALVRVILFLPARILGGR